MAHVLITGGAGFIGTNLALRLSREKNIKVTVLDKFAACDNEEFLKTIGNLSICKGDITDRNLLQEIVFGKDYVIHLAAHTYVRESIEKPALLAGIKLLLFTKK